MLRFLLASTVLVAGPSLAAATFTVSGATANAGSPLNFVIRHTGPAGIVTFQTMNGPLARAGIDYEGATLVFNFVNGRGSATVPIETYADSKYPGKTLTLKAQISVGGRIVSTAGANIVETAPPAPPAPPTPPPTPPTNGEPVLAAGFQPIADNFTTADGICSHDPVTGTCGNYVTSASPDNLGNFRMICGAGQISYDDPIVYPGQPGNSHLHQFYGNLGANGNSTYSSLRTTGGTTCGDPNAGFGVNRSGYWMPAMLDGAGHVVKPEYVAIYYKREPGGSPECTPGNAAFIGICVGIPTGIRFINGYNMLQGNSGDAHPFFYCQDSDIAGVNAKSVSSALQNDIPSVIPLCPVGARLTLNIAGQDCWDGINLDVADHRSHVSHGAYVWNPATNTSNYKCDAAHPYHIPQMSLIAFYVVDANFEAGKWHLSSDEMVPGAVAGTTFHADYWEAWSPGVRDTWLQHCTDGHLQCAGGDLGNGTGIKGMSVPNTSGLVNVPAHP